MSLTVRELNQLKKIVEIATILIEKAEHSISQKQAEKAEKEANKRMRRSGKELAQFRKMLKNLRKQGVPVSELSDTYGVSASYIYQL